MGSEHYGIRRQLQCSELICLRKITLSGVRVQTPQPLSYAQTPDIWSSSIWLVTCLD